MKSTMRPFLLWLLCFYMLPIARGQVEDFLTGIEVDHVFVANNLRLNWKRNCLNGPSGETLVYSRRIDSDSAYNNSTYFSSSCSSNTRIPGEMCDHRGTTVMMFASGSLRTRNINYATSPNPSGIADNTQLTAFEDQIYWTENTGEFLNRSKIYRVIRPSSTPELVWDFESAGTSVVDMRALSSNLIVALLFDGRLVKLQKILLGEPPFQIFLWNDTDIDTNILAMDVFEGRLYFAERTSDRRSVFFRSVRTSDFGGPLLHGLDFENSGHDVFEMAVAEDGIYFQEVGLSSSPFFGGLMRLPFTSSSPVEVSPLSTRIFDIDTAGEYVVWGKNATTISRLLIGSPAIARDLTVSGLEIIQAVQDPGNTVKLIAGKTTCARVFGHIASSTAGETSLMSGTSVILHGSGPSGVLPGSPLNPIANPPLTSGLQFRTDVDDGYWFRLPDEWVDGGTTTFTAEVNPGRALTETNYNNNKIAVTRNIQRKVPICMVIIPTMTHFGTISAYRPEYQETFDYLEALLPTSRLQVDFSSADLLAEKSALGHEGPYEFQTYDDDKDSVMTGLHWKMVFGSGGEHCGPAGGFDHYVAMLPQHETDIKWSGYGRLGTDVLTFSMSIFFFLPESKALGVPRSATTQAQELGHNYGRYHVNCGTNVDNLDTNYPYPDPCHFSTAALGHLGFDPFQRKIFRWDDASDFMSYRFEKWVSPYTWDQMYNRISNSSLAPAAEPPRSEERAAAAFPSSSLVVGMVDMVEETAALDAAFEMNAEQAARAVSQIDFSDAVYELRTYFEGELVGTHPMNRISLAPDEGAHGSDRVGVAGVLETEDPIDQVDLTEVKTGHVLGALTGGGAAPSITILQPTLGQVVSGLFDIKWVATDDSGNPLSYMVRYSHDNGTNWTILAQHIDATILSVDSAKLPGSDTASCVVEVLASDQILTGKATSDPFSISAKAPKAYMFFEKKWGKCAAELANASFLCGEPVILHGVAHDIEEGQLNGPFAWTVTGPENRVASGEEVAFNDLLPGTYAVNLQVTDGDGDIGLATAQLVVQPKYVQSTTGSIVVDGICNDPGYLADTKVMDLRYPDTNLTASVSAVYRAGKLYVCVTGMQRGSNDQQWMSVLVDVDNDGTVTTEYGDLRFDLVLNGSYRSLRGTGPSFSTDLLPNGIIGEAFDNGNRWSAEMCIDIARLGGWNGQTVGLAVAQHHRNYSGDDHFWPPAAIWNNPSTWADVVLGPHANDPTDTDGDRLPDAWEWATFGTLSRDGSQDFDSDGQTDGEEFDAGTNAKSASSKFVAAQFSHPGPGGTVITWPSAPGRTYSIGKSSTINFFVPYQTGIPASGGATTSWTDPAPTQGKAFYSIRSMYCR